MLTVIKLLNGTIAALMYAPAMLWDIMYASPAKVITLETVARTSRDAEVRSRDLRQGIMERWSGKRLRNSAIYGVRVYRRGSMLHNHVDRSDTHIISAIVNVAQQVRCRHTRRHLHAGADGSGEQRSYPVVRRVPGTTHSPSSMSSTSCKQRASAECTRP